MMLFNKKLSKKMDKLYHVRVNNLEFKELEDGSGHINRYYPNDYYGKEGEYILDREDPEFYNPPGRENVHIHKNCFANPESSYVVAIFDPDKEEEPDLRFIGGRIFELDEDDAADFWTVAKMGFNKLVQRQQSNVSSSQN
jgi:hypothetical protein